MTFIRTLYVNHNQRKYVKEIQKQMLKPGMFKYLTLNSLKTQACIFFRKY